LERNDMSSSTSALVTKTILHNIQDNQKALEDIRLEQEALQVETDRLISMSENIFLDSSNREFSQDFEDDALAFLSEFERTNNVEQLEQNVSNLKLRQYRYQKDRVIEQIDVLDNFISEVTPQIDKIIGFTKHVKDETVQLNEMWVKQAGDIYKLYQSYLQTTSESIVQIYNDYLECMKTMSDQQLNVCRNAISPELLSTILNTAGQLDQKLNRFYQKYIKTKDE